MSPQPDPRHDIDGDVYVTPRYLAGSTGIGDPALAPLLDLGWELRHDDLGNVYVNAPDRRVRLGYLPEGEDDGLWRINAYRDPFGPPAWRVCFNDSTPTEFVRAFTTALASAYEQGPDAYLARPVAGSDEHDPFFAFVPLLTQGWEIENPRWGVFAIQAPDGRAAVEFTGEDLDPESELTTRDARWQLWAGTSIDRPAWYSTASTYTPVALLTAVTQCLSDPAPLPRCPAGERTPTATSRAWPGSLPSSHRSRRPLPHSTCNGPLRLAARPRFPR